MIRVADSSFLIAAFDVKDVRGAAALDELRRMEPIHVPVEVLGETLGVVHRRFGTKAARALWTELKRIPHFTFEETTDLDGVAGIFQREAALSWVDAAVVHQCRKLNARALAFDPAIKKLADGAR